MRRGKRRSQGVQVPAARQDGGPLERSVTAGVAADLAGVASQVTTHEVQIRLLERAEIRTAELELPAGRRGGTLILEPAGGFRAEHIGAPVLVVQAPGSSIRNAEAGLVLFVGEVINARQMRIGWFSSEPAPRVVSVHYIIGSR